MHTDPQEAPQESQNFHNQGADIDEDLYNEGGDDDEMEGDDDEIDAA